MTEIRTGIRLDGDASGYKAATAEAGAATQKLDEQQKVLQAGMQRSALSAGEWKNAMRTLPAQMTDIFTGLASGQAPMTVFIQQGGQLRDQFGSVGNVLKGVGSLISPLSVGFAVLGLAAGVVSAAIRRQTADVEALRDTMALTANAAGLTSIRMAQLGERVSAVSGQTQSAAREIALALAASGRTTAALIESQAKAVARLADVSGEDSKKIAAASPIDPAKETVSFCNTGHWAATNWFAMSEVLGQKNVKLYAGSMVEWSQDPNGLPMANVPGRTTQLLQDAKAWGAKTFSK